MARRPDVGLVTDNFGERWVVIHLNDEDAYPVSVLMNPVSAEDLQIQLGSALNTLKGVQKKLPLRDRLRLLRG